MKIKYIKFLKQENCFKLYMLETTDRDFGGEQNIYFSD